MMLVTGDIEAARKEAEVWMRTYPRDVMPRTLLSGLPNKAVGHFAEAASHAREAIELDPDFGMAYYNLGVNSLYLERPDAATFAISAAAKRNLDIEEFQMLEYDLAFCGTMRPLCRKFSRDRGSDTIR